MHVHTHNGAIRDTVELLHKATGRLYMPSCAPIQRDSATAT